MKENPNPIPTSSRNKYGFDLLLAALRRRGLLPEEEGVPATDDDGCPRDLRRAVLEYLGQSRAALLEVRLEEIFGVAQQQNLPGTRKEHPNWRIKLPLNLEKMESSPEPARLAARLNRARGQ